MSYLVLARKYRPQVFADVVGQEHVTRTLENAFAQDRVHHAFLFCGPRGCGKTTTARIVGKALNCESGPTASPCGTCEACRLIAEGRAIDYFEMDGASNRGIDAVRELNDAVRYQPAAFRKKVYVIDEVHMLTNEAFNALLKTLEEPPPHVTFVLATTEPHKVPNTILSRCQRFDFKLVPSSFLNDHIERTLQQEGITIEPEAVQLLTRESGGSVRDALSLCDQVISYVGTDTITEAKAAEVLGVADRALTRSLIEALVKGDVASCLTAVDTAVARGIDEVQIARAMVRTLRDLVVATKAPQSAALVSGSDEEQDEVYNWAKELEPSRLRQMFVRLLRGCDELARTELPRLTLDLALIDLAATEPVVPLGDLIERLGRLEARISQRRGQASGSGGGGGGVTKAEAPKQRVIAQSKPAVHAEAKPTPEPAAKAPVEESPIASAMPDALKAWEEVMGALENAKEFGLMTIYQTAKVLSWTDEAVEIGFPEGDLTSEIASSPQKVRDMEAFLATHAKRRMQLSVRLLSVEEQATASSVIEDAHRRAEEQKKQCREEALQHPMTQTVLKTFGAKIKEIKLHV